MKNIRLNKSSLLKAVKYLEKKDEHLKLVVSMYGLPPLWQRKSGFSTLLYIILEQQVSLASAKAAYNKLLENLGSITPTSFLKLSDEELKIIGFSRQKTSYGRNLAEAVISGSINLSKLSKLDDDKARLELTKIKGIGTWTSDIYLLMALGRPDILPRGDLALLSAVQKLKKMECLPSNEEFIAMSENWKPWRAVATRILWHYYLSIKKQII